MDERENIPLYKLNAVLQETGLSADVVRVWEKRYGLPAPRRSAGGHRLYSRRDIRTLQWLQARLAEGMRISQAVRRWREIEASGLDPLSSTTSSSSFLGETRTEWLHASLDFDEPRATAVLQKAFARVKPEKIIFQVLLPALREVGDMWYRGEASVQQEHFIASLAERQIQARCDALPLPESGRLVIVSTPPHEEHAFPALVTAYLLRQQGIRVLYLGPNVPLLRLDDTIRKTKAALLILSTQQLHTARTLIDVRDILRFTQTALAYGGAIFNRQPALRRRVPGYFLGKNLEQSAQQVQALLQTSTPASKINQPKEPISATWQYLADSLAYADTLLINYIKQSLKVKEIEIPAHELETANFFMLENLIAALRLGNLAFLDTEIDWLYGLIQYRHHSVELLMHYLDAWKHAVQAHLGKKGLPITEWFEKQVALIPHVNRASFNASF